MKALYHKIIKPEAYLAKNKSFIFYILQIIHRMKVIIILIF
jgi:hypothetical protein